MIKKLLIIVLILSFASIAYSFSNRFGFNGFGVDNFGAIRFGAGGGSPASGDSLLLESGDFLLLEGGDKLLLE